eukprot:SAG31_NODE_3967_length_3709_cov_1.268421_1_plen_703_part_00
MLTGPEEKKIPFDVAVGQPVCVQQGDREACTEPPANLLVDAYANANWTAVSGTVCPLRMRRKTVQAIRRLLGQEPEVFAAALAAEVTSAGAALLKSTRDGYLGHPLKKLEPTILAHDAGNHENKFSSHLLSMECFPSADDGAHRTVAQAIRARLAKVLLVAEQCLATSGSTRLYLPEHGGGSRIHGGENRPPQQLQPPVSEKLRQHDQPDTKSLEPTVLADVRQLLRDSEQALSRFNARLPDSPIRSHVQMFQSLPSEDLMASIGLVNASKEQHELLRDLDFAAAVSAAARSMVAAPRLPEPRYKLGILSDFYLGAPVPASLHFVAAQEAAVDLWNEQRDDTVCGGELGRTARQWGAEKDVRLTTLHNGGKSYAAQRRREETASASYVEPGIWSLAIQGPVWVLGSGVIHNDCTVHIPASHSHFLPLHTQLLASEHMTTVTLPTSTARSSMTTTKLASCLQMSAWGFYHFVVEVGARLMVLLEQHLDDPSVIFLVPSGGAKDLSVESVSNGTDYTNELLELFPAALQPPSDRLVRMPLVAEGPPIRFEAPSTLLYVDWDPTKFQDESEIKSNSDAADASLGFFLPPRPLLQRLRQFVVTEAIKRTKGGIAPVRTVVYVKRGRRPGVQRMVANEAAVLDMVRYEVQNNGRFQLVVFIGDETPLRDAVALFAGAAVVIGPHGGGLTFLMIWLPPRSTLVEFGLR